MRILIFDTETTGLPQGRNPSIMDSALWPHIVQLSYIVYDTELSQVICITDDIIDIPENVVISDFCVALHGITNLISKTKGIPISAAIQPFLQEFEKAELVIAHNMEFDLNMLGAELVRLKTSVQNSKIESKRWYDKIGMLIDSTKLYCTMQSSLELCNIKAVYKTTKKEYVKFPSLSELHTHLFGYIPANLHNSLHDSVVCLRCFYKMKFDKDIRDENSVLAEMIDKLKE